MRFIVAILGIGVGVLIIKYRRMIFDWTGHWGWADKFVGGTGNAIVLIGLAIIFLSVVYPTGALDRYFGPDSGNISSSNLGGVMPPSQN